MIKHELSNKNYMKIMQIKSNRVYRQYRCCASPLYHTNNIESIFDKDRVGFRKSNSKKRFRG